MEWCGVVTYVFVAGTLGKAAYALALAGDYKYIMAYFLILSYVTGLVLMF